MWIFGSGSSGEGEGVYCLTVRVMVAREMALRRNQERPCRIRIGSIGSERVEFWGGNVKIMHRTTLRVAAGGYR